MTTGPESTAFLFGTLIVLGLVVFVPALLIWLIRRGRWSRGSVLLGAAWTLVMVGGYWIATAPRREAVDLVERGAGYVQSVAGGELDTIRERDGSGSECGLGRWASAEVESVVLLPADGFGGVDAVSGAMFRTMEAVAVDLEANGWTVWRVETLEDTSRPFLRISALRDGGYLSLVSREAANEGNESILVVGRLRDCPGNRESGELVEHFNPGD